MHASSRLKAFCTTLLSIGAAAGAAALAEEPAASSAAPVLYQQSMNVFRRFAAEPEKMFEFYGDVLGFERLQSFGGVHRFQAGASELKLTGRVQGKTYHPGGVDDATGFRLVTFFFPNEAELLARFEEHGYPVPEFRSLPGSDRKAALATDPDGQPVELVIAPNAPEDAFDRIEVGLTVSNLEESRAFYREFVGLEELAPVEDPLLNATKYPYRHGSTTVNLRHFGDDLPVDTGSGGIQYVVSNVDHVDALAKAREIPIDQPLTADPDAALRTVWLDDPDGVTNYFAETTWSRGRASSASE